MLALRAQLLTGRQLFEQAANTRLGIVGTMDGAKAVCTHFLVTAVTLRTRIVQWYTLPTS